MSVLTSVGIVLFAMLILTLMQLVPGVFSLLLHYTKGKYSKNKASDLATFFILGAETNAVLIFVCIYLILNCSPELISIIESEAFAWAMAGILLAEMLAAAGFYFRKSKCTELFISRRLARSYQRKVKMVKSRSETFVLGLISAIPELVFTLPIYIISVVAIMQLGNTGLERAGLIMVTTFVIILPLIILHIYFTLGRNLAEVTKFRVKNKNFIRCMLGLTYLMVVVLILSGVSL